MPQSVLSANRVLELVGQPIDHAEMEERLFRSKAELTDWTEDALTIEVTPDRLDLLSEGGLALFLQGSLGLKKGPVPFAEPPATLDRGTALVDASVAGIRPYLAGALLVPPPGVALDAGLFAEAIRFQEILHATIGLDRRTASLGLYSWERVKSPLRYTLEPVDGVRFHPLDGPTEIEGSRFFAEHPMAQKYGRLGRSNGECLTLRDADDQLLSLPPILNGRTAGEVRIGDRTLLLESTGTRAVRVEESVGLMLLPFVARGWAVEPLRVEYTDHTESGVGWISPRRLPFTASTLQDVTGLSLPDAQVEEFLAQGRLGGSKAPDGWWVEIPPWRPDLQTSVDITEDILMVRGLAPEEAILPPSATRGRRRAESRFRRSVRRLLLGLGFVELRTTVLAPDGLTSLLGHASAIKIVNPVSDQFSRVRDALQISLLGSLERNLRYSYPQQYSDVGPVVVLDAREPSGGSTRWHAAAVLAGERAGFADAAAWVDYLLGAFGALGVREPAELPGTIPGRAARLRIAGEVVAEMGEIAPSVLAELKLPVPVAWGEVDLTALWPLVRRTETA
jgi:phenylalanyl-tRNA synthetase beta chain